VTRARLLLLGALGGFALPAFARAQGAIRDDRGVLVPMEAPPRRIVSLLPSLTESVCALGGCARLVGTDRFSNWPASVAALPKLGGMEDARVEGIVALKPDVVLVSSKARVTERLEALGVKVLVFEARNEADEKRSLVLLAALLGRPADAERVWAEIERDTRAAAARVPPRLVGKRVYFEVDATPYAAGATSFIGETLARLGLKNAVPAELGAFPKLNPEYVVRLQPDIVMAAKADLADMARRPGWSALRALKEGQTCGFTGERYDLLVRPGPRLGEAALVLADCLVAMTKGR
jgi:iron complex transport system substrate-binding protein